MWIQPSPAWRFVNPFIINEFMHQLRLSPMAHQLLLARLMKTRIAIRVLSLTMLLLTSAGAAQAGSVTLAWNPNTDGNTTGYKIYWGFQPGVYTASLDVGNVTTRLLTGLLDGAPYYFVVRAYNSSRVESGPSTEVSKRVGVPSAVAADFSGDFRSDSESSTLEWHLVFPIHGFDHHHRPSVGRRRRHTRVGRLRW